MINGSTLNGCQLSSVLGVFPNMGLVCSDVALVLASTAIISAFLFWQGVTK